MTKKRLLINTIFSAALICSSVMLAQDPVQNIDSKKHPNLAGAQQLVAQANKLIVVAQKDNAYDMQGHATKARQLLVQVNQELKLAANDADAARQKK